jgi:DNA-directed RNA polymerase subunit RPC12/RpoP
MDGIKHMKKWSQAIMVLWMLCVLLLATAGIAGAQSAGELELGLSRDWGYGGFGNDIQGLFTIKVNDHPPNLSRVVFLIDGKPIGEDAQSPFSLQFNTDSYPLGVHTLSAAGYLSSGQELGSSEINAEFVPAGAATGAIGKILIPIGGLILLMILLSFALPLIRSKGKLSSQPAGTPRNYGIGGGAICPKCSRPFPLRLWFINLGLHKIDRCPYCGKWSFVRPRQLVELRAAEAAELARSNHEPAFPGESGADKLKKELDESRYQDL